MGLTENEAAAVNQCINDLKTLGCPLGTDIESEDLGLFGRTMLAMKHFRAVTHPQSASRCEKRCVLLVYAIIRLYCYSIARGGIDTVMKWSEDAASIGG